MNEAQLSQFNIPTESKSAATAFLRANVSVAHDFAKVFGFDDADDRLALRAAQMATVAIFEEVDDVAGTIGPKVEQYRTYIKNATPATVAPVTVTAVEVVAEPEATVEAVAQVVENVEVSEPAIEVAAEEEATVEEPTAEPEAPAPVEVKKSGRKGRQAYALSGKLTAYQKCVNWLAENGITTTDDRSALAMKMSTATSIPVGSCLVYISNAFKAGVLTK